jgi:hypothetical protein
MKEVIKMTLYTHEFSSQYWGSWLDILSQQIPFEFSIYVEETTQGTRKFFSPDKKHFITSLFDDETFSKLLYDDVDDVMSVVLITNSGAFHILAYKTKNEQVEIMLLPHGSFSRWWNIIKYFQFQKEKIQFQKEKTLLMKHLDNIGQSDFK